MEQDLLVARINSNIHNYNQELLKCVKGQLSEHMLYRPIKYNSDIVYLRDVDAQIMHNLSNLRMKQHDRTKYIVYKPKHYQGNN